MNRKLVLVGILILICLLGAYWYRSEIAAFFTDVKMYYVVAFSAAFFFGIIELLNIFSIGSRRFIGFRNVAAWIYALANGVAGVLAAAIIGFDSDKNTPVLVGLAYGAFGVLILRSSIASVKTASGDVPIGPVVLLDQLKKLLEERVDVQTSTELYKNVSLVMKNVDFGLARQSLVVSCLLMRERMSKADQDRLREDVEKLGQIDGYFASVQLGMLISRVTSLEVLEKGVEIHREELIWKGSEELDLLKARLYTRAPGDPPAPQMASE